ncbi:hypothetical protein L596_009697 [Steinernema carpocapsae]|uniref:Uncharacterized protein n=1 Tax=Steinernema carpocapsae TaxID=34508 RepID=A0A4U5PGM3_STECR|nr:hypothetical protein L596_009697 [Steinernema carpocapsae]
MHFFNHATFVRRIDENQFSLFNNLLKRVPVQELFLRAEGKPIEKAEFLWKMPVRKLLFSRWSPWKIIDYHLFENEHLQKAIVYHGYYDFVIMTIMLHASLSRKKP